jgi:hypothetical protein
MDAVLGVIALVFQGVTFGAIWTLPISSENGPEGALKRRVHPFSRNRGDGLGDYPVLLS